MESEKITTWAGVEYPNADALPVGPPSRGGQTAIAVCSEADETWFLGTPADDRLVCATDPFEDFDDDDFDDEFDDDFEEEWDEELPGDADQFEPDEKVVNDDGVEVEPEFEDED
jgi:hypothetical protein